MGKKSKEKLDVWHIEELFFYFYKGNYEIRESSLKIEKQKFTDYLPCLKYVIKQSRISTLKEVKVKMMEK